MSSKNDNLGNRMKGYENQTCGIKMLPLIPVIARLDGKGFSKLLEKLLIFFFGEN